MTMDATGLRVGILRILLTTHQKSKTKLANPCSLQTGVFRGSRITEVTLGPGTSLTRMF